MASAVSAGKSDKGKVRKTNEDAFRIYHDEEIGAKGRGFAFAVADGIGSYRAGAQAAWIAVDQLGLYFNLPSSGFQGDKTFEELIFRANEVITNMRTTQKGYYGMGSTLTAVLVDPKFRVGLFYNAGDSMAFLARGGKLVPITTAQKGEGSKSAIANHLGLGPEFQLEKVRVVFQPGDTFLLCSDGLTVLSEQAMLDALSLPSPSDAAQRLIDEAITLSDDNVTAVVVSIAA